MFGSWDRNFRCITSVSVWPAFCAAAAAAVYRVTDGDDSDASRRRATDVARLNAEIK